MKLIAKRQAGRSLNNAINRGVFPDFKPAGLELPLQISGLLFVHRLGARMAAMYVRDRAWRPTKRGKLQMLKARRRNRETVQAQGQCPKHLDAFVTKAVRTFANGTMHVEQRCATCNRFIKWGE